MKTLNDILINETGMRLSKITPFHNSMIRQAMFDGKRIKLNNVSHYIMMKLSSNYSKIFNENLRLDMLLKEKTRRLAYADAHASELSVGIRNLTKTCSERKRTLVKHGLL